jgi:hypothetical protein
LCGGGVSGFLRKKAIHSYILFGTGLLTLLVRTTSTERYARERHEIEVKAREQRTRELVAFWNTLNFSSGAQTPDEFVRRIDWNSLALSDLQRDRAKRRVHDTIEYLLNPSFEAYYRLKSEGLQYSFNVNERTKKMLGWTNAATGAQAAYETAGALWTASQKRSATGQPPKLAAISFQRLASITTTSGVPAALLGGKLHKAITIGYDAPNPGFDYPAAARGKVGTAPLFLNLSFYARSNSSTNPGPVHLSFSWRNDDQQWASLKMVSDVQLKLDTLF